MKWSVDFMCRILANSQTLYVVKVFNNLRMFKSLHIVTCEFIIV
jgi:hypothetical protein